MNTVRITSGKYRGRKISTPGGATHPMGERERLALFNMISPFIQNASVLDAFAGSGALGIEALSRGAREAVFIEYNLKAAAVIRKNLDELRIKAEVIIKKVSSYETEKQFDLIIADPPYDAFDLEEVVPLAKSLKEGGVFVLSHPGETPEIPGLILEKSRNYASATISIYRKA